MSSAAAAYLLPSDPAERRRLWRAWIATDAPAGDRPRATVRRVAPQSEWLGTTFDQPADVVDVLRAQILAVLVDGQLPLSDRQRFTRRAIRAGMTRFEASLLIAAVQHQAGGRAPVRVGTRPRSMSVRSLVGVALVIEVCAALIVWISL